MKNLRSLVLSREFRFGVAFLVIGIVLFMITVFLKPTSVLNDGFYGGLISLSIELLLIGLMLILSMYITAGGNALIINCGMAKKLIDGISGTTALLVIWVPIILSIYHITINSPIAIVLITLTGVSFFAWAYVYGYTRKHCWGKP